MSVWVAALLVAACAGGGEGTTVDPSRSSPVGSATSPEAIVEDLLEALRSGDLEAAAALGDPSQAVLVALAEGAAPRRVADMSDVDLETVAANFWAGFTEQFSAFLATDVSDLRVDEVGERQAGASRFAAVDVVLPADASRRVFVTRETASGWVVDLVATFPSPLVVAVPEVSSVVRQSGVSGLGPALSGLADSLVYVLEDPDPIPELNQAAIAALESIGR